MESPVQNQGAFVQHSCLMRFQTQGKLGQNGHGFSMITDELQAWLSSIDADMGTLTAFVKHTSCSLTIQENADPTVRDDLSMILDELAPEDQGYKHCDEGPDDMPAHIKTMLTSTSLTIPVLDGQLDLGTWQGIYLIEHRSQPHTRSLRLLFQGALVRR